MTRSIGRNYLSGNHQQLRFVEMPGYSLAARTQWSRVIIGVVAPTDGVASRIIDCIASDGRRLGVWWR